MNRVFKSLATLFLVLLAALPAGAQDAASYTVTVRENPGIKKTEYDPVAKVITVTLNPEYIFDRDASQVFAVYTADGNPAGTKAWLQRMDGSPAKFQFASLSADVEVEFLTHKFFNVTVSPADVASVQSVTRYEANGYVTVSVRTADGFTFEKDDYEAAGGDRVKLTPPVVGQLWRFEVYTDASSDVTLSLEPKITSRVIYNLGDQGDPIIDTFRIATRTQVPLGSFSMNHTGLIFSGWNTLPDGSGYSFNVGDMVPLFQDRTFYAIWNRYSYRVTYSANGGIGSRDEENYSVTDGGAYNQYTVPDGNMDFMRPGYHFSRWSLSAGEATTRVFTPGAVETLTNDIDLHALWTPKGMIAIWFDSEGGAGAMSPIMISMGDEVELPYPLFHKPGYNFVGWRSEDGSEYQPGQTFAPMSDVTFSAVWSAKNVSRSYDLVTAADLNSLKKGDRLMIVASVASEAGSTTHYTFGWRDFDHIDAERILLMSRSGYYIEAPYNTPVYVAEVRNGKYALTFDGEHLQSVGASGLLSSSFGTAVRWTIEIDADNYATITDTKSADDNNVIRFAITDLGKKHFGCFEAGDAEVTGVKLYVYRPVEPNFLANVKKLRIPVPYPDATNFKIMDAFAIGSAIINRSFPAGTEYVDIEYDAQCRKNACHPLRINYYNGTSPVRSREIHLPLVVDNHFDTREFHNVDTHDCEVCDIIVNDGGYIVVGEDHFYNNAVRSVSIYPYAALDVRSSVNIGKITIYSGLERSGSVYLREGGNIESLTGAVDVRKIGRNSEWQFFSIPSYSSLLNKVTKPDGSLAKYGEDFIVQEYNEKNRALKYSNRPGDVVVEGDSWVTLPESGSISNSRGYLIGFANDEYMGYGFSIGGHGVDFMDKESYGCKVNFTTPGADSNNPSIEYKPEDCGWNLLTQPVFHPQSFRVEAPNGDILPIVYWDGEKYQFLTKEESVSHLMQAYTSFFVQVPAAGTLTLVPTGGSDAGLETFGGTPVAPAPRLASADTEARLSLVITSGATAKSDRAQLAVGDYAAAYEIGDDLHKMMTYAAAPQIYSFGAGTSLAINALAFDDLDGTRLGFYAPSAGGYSISLSAAGAPLGSTILLVDNLLGVTHNLSDGAYSFSVDRKGSDDSRFSIAVARVVTGADDTAAPGQNNGAVAYATADHVVVENVADEASVAVYDLAGRLVAGQTPSAGRCQFALPDGIYIVEIAASSSRQSIKVVK